MRRRLLTTLCLWAFLGLVLGFGKLIGGQILLLIIALGVMKEIAGLLKKKKIALNLPALLLALGLTLAGHFWGLASMGTSLGLIITLLAHAKSDFKAIPVALGSLVVVAAGLGSFNAIATLTGTHSIWQAVWVIGAIKLADGGAYLMGTHLGKNPLLPAISPAKTFEGLFGALISGALIGLIGAPLFSNPWFAPLLGIALAFVGSIGDLLESLFKRWAGVKDSGKILPGIGGLLDLCDSLILAGPVAWLAIRFLG